MFPPAIVRSLALAFVFSLSSGCSDEDTTQLPEAARNEPAELLPTVDEDPTLEALDLSSTRVQVQELGNPRGDVIIVLHGGPGDDYRSLLPLAGRAGGVSLADAHRLVFWDQRGTGLSRRHDADALTLETYARDLDELIDHYSPGAPVSLLGHSWGGTYATLYLDRHPERVRAAALLEPGGLSSALRNDDGIEEQRTLLDQIVGPFLGTGRDVTSEAHANADQALAEAFRAMNPNAHVPHARFGALALRELEFGALQQRFDFTTHLDRVGFEVLFIAGGASETRGAAQQERQRAFFPRSRLEVIEGADHDSITLDDAGAVIPLLVSYFAGTTPVARQR